jgi:hypothetical protein
MQDTIFNLFVSLVIVFFLAFCYWAYWQWFQGLAALTGFGALEIRVLKWQLLALAVWTLLAVIGSAVALWLGQQYLFSLPGRLAVAVANWLLFGSIAATSIVPGVSIIGMRNGGRPTRGRVSVIWGVLMLAFLAFWTYQTVLRPA